MRILIHVHVFVQKKSTISVLVTKVKPGTVIGIGVHYSPSDRERPEFDYQAQQLVMIFLTLDKELALTRLMIQPEGGFFPLVVLRRECKSNLGDCFKK